MTSGKYTGIGLSIYLCCRIAVNDTYITSISKDRPHITFSGETSTFDAKAVHCARVYIFLPLIILLTSY